MVSLRHTIFTTVCTNRHPYQTNLDGVHMIIGAIRWLRNAVGVSDFTEQRVTEVYLLTYFGPWLLLGHRTCTTSLQRLLSWAIISSCFQLSSVCLMSSSRSRRQVCFGFQLFRLPWGFHVKACLVMLVFGFLNVWPSHPHLLLRMSISI